MSVKKGLERWTCDRCGREIIRGEGESVDGWKTVRHIDINDAVIERLVCPECYTRFKDCARYRDKAFDEYMSRRDEVVK